MKAKDIKLDQINSAWREVNALGSSAFSEINTVFLRILKTFDSWILTLLKRLETGELVTSDLLVFEENLSVRFKRGCVDGDRGYGLS